MSRIEVKISLFGILKFYILFNLFYSINDTIYFKEGINHFLKTLIINIISPISILNRTIAIILELNILSLFTYFIIFSLSFFLSFTTFKKINKKSRIRKTERLRI